MKFVVTVVLVFVALAQAAPVLKDSTFDLSTWEFENFAHVSGDPGNWDVQPGNIKVIETSNSHPTVFFKNIDAGSQSITGIIRVDSSENDDDFVGFVLGFDKGEGSSNDADFLLIDWKQGEQTAYGFANPGLALSRVRGDTSQKLMEYQYWTHCRPDRNYKGTCDTVKELARGAIHGYKGYNDDQDYAFEFQYNSGRLVVTIDNQVEIDYEVGPGEDVLPMGLLGFYAFSQGKAEFTMKTSKPVFKGVETIPIHFSHTFSDTANNSPYVLTVDCGDSASTSGSLSAGNYVVTGICTFPTAGFYSGSITVTDKNNDSDTIDVEFQVLPEESPANLCPASSQTYGDIADATPQRFDGAKGCNSACLRFV